MDLFTSFHRWIGDEGLARKVLVEKDMGSLFL